MAKSILDSIMDTLKGVEKDQSTLTINEGGRSIDLFANDAEVYKDFDSLMEEILLSDEAGRARYSQLVESGNINKLKELWVMGGSPGLSYSGDKEDRSASYSTQADAMHYAKTGKPYPGEWPSGTINIHDGKDMSSYDKFDNFIAELSHGIGKNNPSIMKLGPTKMGSQSFQSGETSKFFNRLDAFPVPESPQDSLAAYIKFAENIQLPEEYQKNRNEWTEEQERSFYDIEGSTEQITHSRIEPALRLMLEREYGLPWREGYNREEW